MSTTFNRAPTYDDALTQKGATSRGWFTYWFGLGKGQPTGPIAAISPGVSPYTFTAPQGGTVLVQGGTVSLIQITRDGVNNFNTGQTQGAIPVSQGDSLIVNYSVVPTLTFIPR
jgi:hypothetical protein